MASGSEWEATLRYLKLAVIAVPLALGVTPAEGQIFGGQVVDDQTNTPLVGLFVVLRRQTPDSSVAVDSVRTDARGYFVAVARGTGGYRLAFRAGGDLLGQSPVDSVADTSAVIERQYRLPVSRISQEKGFFEFQVDKPALSIRAPNSAPIYPKALKSAAIQGRVEASFIVDANGRADRSTFVATRSTHACFTKAVREALPRMRFVPASIGGVAVRQKVQQAFEFRLDGLGPLPSAGSGAPAVVGFADC